MSFKTYRISNSLLNLSRWQIRIDKLVSQCAIGQVRSLGNVEDLVEGRFEYSASGGGPELTQDSEK